MKLAKKFKMSSCNKIGNRKCGSICEFLTILYYTNISLMQSLVTMKMKPMS